jgi:hypothetical protein
MHILLHSPFSCPNPVTHNREAIKTFIWKSSEDVLLQYRRTELFAGDKKKKDTK